MDELKEVQMKSSNAFEVLAKDAMMVLNEIKDVPCLFKFKEEYENLHAALQKSHENERRLIKKARDLEQEISLYTQRVSDTVRHATGNQEIILQITFDRNILQQRIAEANEKSNSNKELCERLKQDIESLHASDQSGVTQEDEQRLQSLSLQKELQGKELERVAEDVEHLTKVSQTCRADLEELERRRDKSNAHIAHLKEQITGKKHQTQQEVRHKEELDEKIKEMKFQSDENHSELRAKQQALSHEQQMLAKIEGTVKDIGQQEYKLEQEYKRLLDDKRICEGKLEEETSKNAKLISENQEREVTLKGKREEMLLLRKELDQKLGRLNDGMKKKISNIEEMKKKTENDKVEHKRLLQEAQTHADRKQKEIDSDTKRVESMLRERDILNKNVIKSDDKTKRQIELVKIKETEIANLRKDIHRWKVEVADFRRRIFQVEKQREKVGVNLSAVNAKYFAALEELKSRDERLEEVKKQIADVKGKLSQQKNLYDAVVADRNVYSKNLIESNEEIAVMETKFKIMHHTIEQLKEEIREKDHALIREKYDEQKLDTGNGAIRESLERAKRRLGNLTTILDTQHQEVRKLEKVCTTAETEKEALRKEYQGVVEERQILNVQLIKRNEELVNRYEALKIQQTKLLHGENEYKAVCSSVGELQKQISVLKDEVLKTRSQMSSTEGVKRQIHGFERELIREQCKVKYLEEELKNPMNVHRWRQLEGSDPQAYEMILNIKGLQKRLITKTEEVIECDMLIHEKEKLYVQLKNILARQPGPEVQEQLQWYTRSLKEKTAQMRTMANELSAYHKECEDLKMDVTRYKGELQAAQNEYFARRRAGTMGIAQVDASP